MQAELRAATELEGEAALSPAASARFARLTKTLSRAERRPTESAPDEHRRLAQARHLDARRVGNPLREQLPDGLEQEVAVRPETAAEDDELDVGDGGDRSDVKRDPPGHLVARHAPRAASPARAAAKIARGS